MWNKNNKSNKKVILLKRILKNRKFYSEEALEVLKEDILNDLELDTEKQNERLAQYIDYLVNQENMDLSIIKNSILSGINSEYLTKLNFGS